MKAELNVQLCKNTLYLPILMLDVVCWYLLNLRRIWVIFSGRHVSRLVSLKDTKYAYKILVGTLKTEDCVWNIYGK